VGDDSDEADLNENDVEEDEDYARHEDRCPEFGCGEGGLVLGKHVASGIESGIKAVSGFDFFLFVCSVKL